MAKFCAAAWPWVAMGLALAVLATWASRKKDK